MGFENIELLSSRKWNDYFPMQVVYEWEDVLAQKLSIKIDLDTTGLINNYYTNKFGAFVQRVIRNSFLKNFIDSGFNILKRGDRKNKKYLCFVLYPSPIKNHYFYSSSIIPILLDCFMDTIDQVPYLFRKNPIVYVTNKEVFDYLLNTTIKDKIRYLPISISDKYFSGVVPIKKIDVIQLGRKNNVLHNWMLRFVAENPKVEYVFGELIEGEIQYVSTNGRNVDEVKTREEFMRFLGEAKISLLSSPGIDGGEMRTGGFNPVTPRFYESAVNYCYMVGRFPDSSDFLYNQIDLFCERPQSYDEFQRLVVRMLSVPFDQTNTYNNFIRQHLTGLLSNQIRFDLLKINSNT